MVPSGMRTVARVGRLRVTGAAMSPMVALGMACEAGPRLSPCTIDLAAGHGGGGSDVVEVRARRRGCERGSL